MLHREALASHSFSADLNQVVVEIAKVINHKNKRCQESYFQQTV